MYGNSDIIVTGFYVLHLELCVYVTAACFAMSKVGLCVMISYWLLLKDPCQD